MLTKYSVVSEQRQFVSPFPGGDYADTGAPLCQRHAGSISARSQISASGRRDLPSSGRRDLPSDTVVCVNTRSGVYHFAGTHNYGHTKEGAYMCEADAKAAGDRAAMNEHHP